MYYLYVKTHRKTGLKYLGKTKQDPYKYMGSGIYWTNHIKKHGYDIDTEILRECSSNDEIKEWGMYYSQLWNVVDNEEWANMRPEEGDGGVTVSGDNHPMKKEEHVSKLRGDNHYSKKNNYEWKLKGSDHPMKKEENLAKISGDNHYSKQQDFQGKLFGGKKSALDPEVVKKRSGDNHYTKKSDYVPKKSSEIYNYDHMIYKWRNKFTGKTVEMTRHEFVKQYLDGCRDNISNLINNKRHVKSVKGWEIIKDEN